MSSFRGGHYSVHVVESGDGSRHLVEAEYLEPEVHSLMEIDCVEIDPAKLSRKILLVSEPPERLKGTHVLKYIKWGEAVGQRFDQRPSCASRMPSRQWYDLAPAKPGALLWPFAHQYRHIVPLNPKGIISNKRLFDVYPNEGIPPKLLCAVLNSTIIALLKYLYGRQVGREGNLDTEVVDARMMLVPNVRLSNPSSTERLERAYDTLNKRPSRPLLEELDDPARIEVDDAAFDLLGIEESEEREKLRSQLYSEMTQLYGEIREVELKKQGERRITARRERASPHTIAEEVWKEFDKAELRRFPGDFIPDGELAETVTLPAGKPKVLDDLFHKATLQVNGTLIKLGSKVRAEFAAKIAELGHYGPAPVPKTDRACERALETYRRYEAQMDATFKELAEERSADPEIQSRIVRELWKLFYASTRHT